MEATDRATGLLVATAVALLLGFVWFVASLEAKTATEEDPASVTTAADGTTTVGTADVGTTAEGAAAEGAAAEGAAAEGAAAEGTAAEGATATAEDTSAARVAAAEGTTATNDTTAAGDTTAVEDTTTINDTTIIDETTTVDDTTTLDDTTAAASQTCANPVQVDTFSGTEDLRTEPFRITGNAFRITYETEPLGENATPTLEVDVLDQAGQPLDEGIVAIDGVDGSETIAEGPGTFRLDIRAVDVRYTVTVEDCRRNGDDNNNNDNNGSGSGNCVRPLEVESISGEGDRRTQPFRITGNSFRITFETEPIGADTALANVEVDVLDQNERPTGEGFVATAGEDGSVNIPDGPGTFRLDIVAERASYTITVDDCRGDDGRRRTDDGRRRFFDRDDGDRRGRRADVIVDTIPRKKLPDTGGPAAIPLAIGMLLVGGALAGAIRGRGR